MGGPPCPLRGPPLRITTNASWARLLPCCSTSTTLPHRRGRRRTREDLVHHQRHGRRAGHLVLDTASLATHTTSDAGPGRSRAPWTAAPPRLKHLEPSPRCFDHIHNHLDNPARNTHSPANARADSVLGGRPWQGGYWHTPVILSTILIHVGSPRVHVCNALGGSWTTSWHIPDIPSSLLIYVGMPCKRVYQHQLSGFRKDLGDNGYREVHQA